jgi:hypothetical protein
MRPPGGEPGYQIQRRDAGTPPVREQRQKRRDNQLSRDQQHDAEHEIDPDKANDRMSSVRTAGYGQVVGDVRNHRAHHQAGKPEEPPQREHGRMSEGERHADNSRCSNPWPDHRIRLEQGRARPAHDRDQHTANLVTECRLHS